MKDAQELIEQLPIFTFEPFEIEQTECAQACLRLDELEEGTELQLSIAQVMSLDISFDGSKLGELSHYELKSRILPLLKVLPDLLICRVYKLEKEADAGSVKILAIFELNEKYHPTLDADLH